jgi:uncharacterized protein YfdQ (DUF2303 family)
MNTDKPDNSTLLNLAASAYPAAGKVIEIDDVPHMLVPNNCVLERLEKHLAEPTRIRATATLTEPSSFVAYVKDFDRTGTKLFAIKVIERIQIIAILDYPEVGEPSWATHKATLELDLSRDLLRWRSRHGKPMTQEGFVEWVEDEARFFTKPAAAEMLTVARDIELRKDVVWKSTAKQPNGDIAMSYVSETKAGAGKAELPAMFTIMLPVLSGGATFAVEARLRPRLNEGSLSISFELVGLPALIDFAMDDAKEKIETELQRPILMGAVSINQ